MIFTKDCTTPPLNFADAKPFPTYRNFNCCMMKRHGLDNVALETAGRKPEELHVLATKTYDNYIAPFLDDILLNWCRLHRQNNAFAQVI